MFVVRKHRKAANQQLQCFVGMASPERHLSQRIVSGASASADLVRNLYDAEQVSAGFGRMRVAKRHAQMKQRAEVVRINSIVHSQEPQLAARLAFDQPAIGVAEVIDLYVGEVVLVTER